MSGGWPALVAVTLHKKEGIAMASRGKKKTTFAKLARESRLRERRIEKQAKKEARKRASADRTSPPDPRPDEEN